MSTRTKGLEKTINFVHYTSYNDTFFIFLESSQKQYILFKMYFFFNCNEFFSKEATSEGDEKTAYVIQCFWRFFFGTTGASDTHCCDNMEV
jgi:hypothetical protein